MKSFVWFISLRSLLFRIVDVCMLKPVHAMNIDRLRPVCFYVMFFDNWFSLSAISKGL